MISSRPRETHGSSVTEWVPLVSADWPTNSACSAAIFSNFGGEASAYDPTYGASIDRTLACLPSFAASTLLNPNFGSSTGTISGFGPMECAGDYTTAFSRDYGYPYNIYVACCPSNYVLEAADCFSTVTSGQVFNYVLGYLHPPSDTTFESTSKTVTTTGKRVYAPVIIGFNFPEPTTTSLSSIDPSVTKGLDFSEPTNTNKGGSLSSSTPLPVPPDQSPPFSAAAKARIGIGVGIGVALSVLGMGAILVAFLLLRCHRMRFSSVPNHQPDSVVPGVPEMASPHIPQEIIVPTPVEMSAEECGSAVK